MAQGIGFVGSGSTAAVGEAVHETLPLAAGRAQARGTCPWPRQRQRLKLGLQA